MISVTDRIADAPSGPAAIGDSRFGTSDIRLSSALCCLGFDLKMSAQPCSVTIDADREQRIITFFHEGNSLNPDLNKPDCRINAHHVEAWWSAPGKFSIEGYDDALTAIHRVFIERERMIRISKDCRASVSDAAAFHRNALQGTAETSSLHQSAILAACEIPVTGYERQTRRWIFGKGAVVILELITAGGKPKDARPLSNDLCIDWMLLALRYRDWLFNMVRDPDCIPLIEMRDGERVLQISAGMDDREQRKWISYL